MAIFRDIMDKLSRGSFGRAQDTDLQKVIAERDALKMQLAEVTRQFSEMYTVVKEVMAAKDSLIKIVDELAAENLLLRTALGTKAGSIEVKH